MTRNELAQQELELYSQIRKEADLNRLSNLRLDWEAVVGQIRQSRAFSDSAKEKALLVRVEKHSYCVPLLIHAAKLEQQEARATAQ